MYSEELSNLLISLTMMAPRIAIGLIVVAIVLVIYKVLSRSLGKMSKRMEMQPHVENSLRLVIRVCALIVASTSFLTIMEVDTTWFLGGSAIIGAAIGFGSSQTINNIVAGFYVIISRPFRVSDYVKISTDIEGQVEEITINYTKLYTPSFNLLYVPNTQIMNSRVLNCTHEGFIKYTFTLDLPHGMISSNDELEVKCFKPAVDEFHEKYINMQLRKPEYYFESSGSFSRTFKLRIFIPKGEAKTLFTLKPELVDMIMNRWDEMRKS